MADLKIFAKTVEQEAINQVNNLLNQEAFKDCKVRIMPDTHAGAGCVIGFTADLGDKIIPNIVGVDIGCGMLTANIGKDKIDFEKLDKTIRECVPFGKNVHSGRIVNFPNILNLYCYRDLKHTKRFERSIGTLGGGNHFIEVDKSSNGDYYLIVHTGSRNLGKQVADYYQELAFAIMKGKDKLFEEQDKIIKEYKEEGRRSEIQSKITQLNKEYQEKHIDIPKELCYLTGKHRDMYLHDMKICQEFAEMNRNLIVSIIVQKMGWVINDIFQTIHNYIDHNSNIVRKGAISAKQGELLLIPINMRDGCILGKGKGNEDWNYSAPHGAGRLMSRNKARESLSLEEYKDTMSGIFTTSVSSDTIDEAPMAYKNIDEIIECIQDTVDIIDILKPVYNFKAGE